MQPAAAEINRKCRAVADRPCPPAKPRPRLDEETIDTGTGEPPAGSDASCAAADNHHLGIAADHAVFCDDLGRVASRVLHRHMNQVDGQRD